jgi:hypothetical protein
MDAQLPHAQTPAHNLWASWPERSSPDSLHLAESMHVVSYTRDKVVVEDEGHPFHLWHCFDQYVAHTNGAHQGGREQVEIWEDGQGTVLRLNRPLTPGAVWTA